MKVILQTNQSDCLLACAAMIMNTLGCKVPVYKLIENIAVKRGIRRIWFFCGRI